jgi:flagellar biogenesis protein FliO
METSGPVAQSLPGLGASLAVSVISLGVVCLLAYLGLKLLARRGVGRASGPIRIVARCPLEPRRSLYLVETAGRFFLLGVGEGPLTMLADLGALDLSMETAAGVAPAPAGRFTAALAKAMARKPGNF